MNRYEKKNMVHQAKYVKRMIDQDFVRDCVTEK